MNSRKKILFIDKDIKNALLLKEIFYGDYDIISSSSNEKTKEILDDVKNQIAVILFSGDLIEKDNANEIKEYFKSISQFSIPTIGVITKEEDELENMLLSFGAIDCITKPYNAKNIYQKIKNIVNWEEKNNKEKDQIAFQLQTIMDNMMGSVILIEVGEKCRCIHANKGFFSYNGYSNEEYLSKYRDDMEKYIHPDDCERVRVAIKEGLESNRTFTFEFREILKDNSIKWVHIQGTQIPYEESEYPVILSVLTDITKLKDTEIELTKTSLQLSSVIDNLSCGIAIFEVGESLKLVYGNDRLASMTGYSKEEYKKYFGNDILLLIHKDDAQDFLEEINKAIVNEEIVKCSFRITRGNGEIAWVRLSAEKIGEENNHPLLYCVILDINNEKEQEEKNIKTTEELKYRADYDLLTGIYNKNAFCRATLAMLKRNPETKYILLQWNVEQFKIINALMGISMGDAIIKRIANKFAQLLSRNGTYGRLEADHFVTCFPKYSLDIETMHQEISESLKELSLNNQIVLDIGIFEIDDTNVSVEQMCDFAGLAMQSIKGKFLKHHAYYDDDLRKRLFEEREISSEMFFALENHEFVIYLQPIYSLSKNKTIGAEALARWIHPQKGIISPGVFIPIFEKNGFISQLDFFIWEEACKYIKKRMENNQEIVPISVNVSRLSLYNHSLCQEIIDLVEAYGINPNYLRLEITETAYNDNPNQLLKTVAELQKNGFKILMDDFGSGYSSLNTLKDIPVDILKIDMKFLGGLGESKKAESILTSIVRMAKWLDVPIVAEGVETKTQLEFLRSIGCDRIQGYFFSQPLPISAFDKYVSTKTKVQVATSPLQLVANSFDLESLFSGNELLTYFLSNITNGVGVYELNKNSLNILRGNESYYSIMKHTSESFYRDAHNVLNKVYEDDRKALISACKRVARSQKIEKIKFRRYRNDGVLIWLDANINYLGGSEERPLISITVNDITDIVEDRKVIVEQEQTITRTYKFLDNLYDTIPCGIIQYTISDNPKLISANQSACNMLEYVNEKALIEDVQGDVTKIISQEDIDSIYRKMKSFIGETKKISHESLFRKKSGLFAWYRGIATKAVNAEGVELIQNIFVDISEEKYKEAIYNQNVFILNESLSALRTGVVHWEDGKKAKIIYLSKCVCDIFGYSQDEYSRLLMNGKISSSV